MLAVCCLYVFDIILPSFSLLLYVADLTGLIESAVCRGPSMRMTPDENGSMKTCQVF